MPNPTTRLKCPYCGARLTYDGSEGEANYYTCVRHGALVLTPDVSLRQTGPADIVMRWPDAKRARWQHRVRQLIEAGTPTRAAEQMALDDDQIGGDDVTGRPPKKIH